MDIGQRDDFARQPYDEDKFSGEAALNQLPARDGSSDINVSMVDFTNGGRTNWHAHPGGQVLYILEGEGCVVTADEELRVRPGDVVRTAGGVNHWHGALAGADMSHLAVAWGPTDWSDPPDRPEPLPPTER